MLTDNPQTYPDAKNTINILKFVMDAFIRYFMTMKKVSLKFQPSRNVSRKTKRKNIPSQQSAFYNLINRK